MPTPAAVPPNLSRSRRFTPQEKFAHLEGLKASGESLRAYGGRVGVTANTLIRWHRAYEERGLSGLEAKANPRNSHARGVTRKRFTPEERRQAIEAYHKSGRTLRDFGALWGVSVSTLSR